MRRLRIVVAILTITGLTALGLSGMVHAQSFKSGTDVTVPAGNVVDSTLFSAGRTIDIDGTVNGDVFCAGQTVTISGTIHGDVICAAQTITISGTVDGSVRLAGQTVTINGTVSRNATIAAQTFTGGGKSRVDGDMSVAGQSATLNGTVGRDVAFSGGSLTIAGTIGRHLTGSVEHLTLAEHAALRGGGSYTSVNAAHIARGAAVTGTLAHNAAKPKAHHAHHGSAWGFRLYWGIACLFAAFVLALLLPGLFQQSSQAAMDRPLKTVLVGLIASIAAPVVFIALMLTVLGIPLGLLFGLVWFITLILAWTFAAYYVGRLLLSRTQYKNALFYMLLGAVVLLITEYIPFINGLVMLAALWFGLGMIILHIYSRYTRPRYGVKEA